MVISVSFSPFAVLKSTVEGPSASIRFSWESTLATQTAERPIVSRPPLRGMAAHPSSITP